MSAQISIEEFLALFTSQELGEALGVAGELTGGTKPERIARIAALPMRTPELLDHFSADTLRYACSTLGVSPGGRKAETIAALSRRIAARSPRSENRERGSVSNAGLFSEMFDAVPTMAVSGVAPPPASAPAAKEFMAPTREALLERLSALSLPRRRVRVEADAQELIGAMLRESFAKVAREYHVGGYLGLKIDVDIGDGKAGVEVKLASSLMKAGEVHRLIGQAIYYHRRRYREALVIAIVGNDEDLDTPVLREATAFLAEIGIVSVSIRLVN